MTKQIQETVARADLIVCVVIRWTAFALILTAVLLACLIATHFLARAGPNPDVIDYDVTSEGPEGDFTPAFYEWEDEDNDMG